MFEDQDYVCKLKATMRFRGDPILTSILSKMRTPGEDRSNLRLTEEQWRVLQRDGDVVSICFCVVLRVHGAMGQVAAVGHLSPGDSVHVRSKRPHHECGHKRPPRGARQAPPDTQHEHNRVTSCRLITSPKDAGSR